MKIYTRLKIKENGATRTVLFGQPDTKIELLEMYKLRFNAYSQHNYIVADNFPDGAEKDEEDVTGKCQYFVAKIEGGEMIGTVRLILKDPLPTEEYFSFTEPVDLQSIKQANRGELGRLIVIKPSEKNYFPRNLVLLFIIDLLVGYGQQHNITAGYVFVKTSLLSKLKRLKAPLHVIEPYEQHYPKGGVLERYFNQADDPVIPAYYITEEFKEFTQKIIHSGRFFEKVSDSEFILKSSPYMKFLKLLKII